MNLWMRKRQRKSTPKTSKMYARMSFAVRLPIYCLLERAREWLLGEGD